MKQFSFYTFTFLLQIIYYVFFFILKLVFTHLLTIDGCIEHKTLEKDWKLNNVLQAI